MFTAGTVFFLAALLVTQTACSPLSLLAGFASGDLGHGSMVVASAADDEDLWSMVVHGPVVLTPPMVVHWADLHWFLHKMSSEDECTYGCSFLVDSLTTLTAFAAAHPDAWRTMSDSKNDVVVTMDVDSVPQDLREARSLTLFIDTAFFVATRSGLYEVFTNRLRDDDDGANGVFTVQSACPGSYHYCNPRTNFWERRANFHGAHVVAGVFDGKQVNNVMFREVFDIVASKLNFTIAKVPTIDGTWGSSSPSSFSGLVGMAQRDEVDIVPEAVTFISARSEVIAYSRAVSYYVMQLHLLGTGRSRWVTHLPSCGCSTPRPGREWRQPAWSSQHAWPLPSGLGTGSRPGLQWPSSSWARCTRGTKRHRLLILSSLLCGTVCFAFYLGGFLSYLAVETFIPPPIESLSDVLHSDWTLVSISNT